MAWTFDKDLASTSMSPPAAVVVMRLVLTFWVSRVVKLLSDLVLRLILA